MKKLALVLALGVLLLAIPVSTFAQIENWEGNVHKGDISVGVGIGIGFGFTIVPGFEWVWGDWKLGDVFPLALGVAAKGSINFYSTYWSSYGAAGMLTAHVGLKGLDIPDFLQRFDFYAGAGVGFVYYSYDTDVLPGWAYDEFSVTFATTEGTTFYITDNFALYLEYNYWGWSRGVLGVLYRF
jgi:hypothetical protein